MVVFNFCTKSYIKLSFPLISLWSRITLTSIVQKCLKNTPFIFVLITHSVCAHGVQFTGSKLLLDSGFWTAYVLV